MILAEMLGKRLAQMLYSKNPELKSKAY